MKTTLLFVAFMMLIACPKILLFCIAFVIGGFVISIILNILVPSDGPGWK